MKMTSNPVKERDLQQNLCQLVGHFGWQPLPKITQRITISIFKIFAFRWVQFTPVSHQCVVLHFLIF